jgi:hypothetical protein
MSEADEAEKIWREVITNDVALAYYFISHFSSHPKKQEMLDAAKKQVLDAVEKAKVGEKAVIYVTKKGKKRYLEMLTQEQLEEDYFSKGLKPKYLYIPELDLRNRTVDTRISCLRCVIGKVLGWNSTFTDALSFTKGFILEDFHFGKKWKGNGAFEPPATIGRVYLDHNTFFGKVDFDSVKVNGRVANVPFAVFAGGANFRNTQFAKTADFRFAHFASTTSFKSARFLGSAYFSYAHFADFDLSRALVVNRPMHFASAIFGGDLLVEEATFHHGVTFENARFNGNVTFRRCKVDDQMNFSRIVTTGNFTFQRNEAKDLLMYGGEVKGDAHFDNCVLNGRTRFALDELTRRDHLEDVNPLHKLYKLYQGDDDAEEDLTTKAQYGVTHVDDLVSRFHGTVSFANTYFTQFVGFERVQFGQEGQPSSANFYNAQFGGEAHFERARFYGFADFRTVAGKELSFNQARFYTDWLMDDANVPGRLSTTEVEMVDGALLSLAGADIRSFGIGSGQLLDDRDKVWEVEGHNLFYERCMDDFKHRRDTTRYLDDPRLTDARWDASGERELTDSDEIARRTELLCISRTIDEFTRLRDSFSTRSMSDEDDWAYWHLKHYTNHRKSVEGGVLGKVGAFVERVIFEKAFGWGVLLINLLATAAVVVVIFAVLKRVLCGDMEVDWDGQPTQFRRLSVYAILVISMHSFLGGFGNSEHLVTNSTATYKYLFTAEIMIGIIVITFFIGAYTRLVLSGG